MIKYALKCDRDHEFDIWFSKSSDFDEQAPKGLILCPYCGSVNVEKAIMAPHVATSRKKDAMASKQVKAANLMTQVADKIRKEIETHCDDVGDKFAEEARAIHYGEKPERGIYGQATNREVVALAEEGVELAPLPEVLHPKSKKKLN